MSKFCRNCGQSIEDNINFCHNCGNIIKNGKINNLESSNSINCKDKIAAGILGICLGSLGIHNFYLGYNGKGLAQLLMTLLSCGVLAVISQIWGLIEGVMILTGSINVDANGNPLK